MKPLDIYNAFVSRVEKTNMLYQAVTDDSPIEMLSTIYFKYYFDISTAIEATIRGIEFERCRDDSYINYLVKPELDKSFFLAYEELEKLIDMQMIYSIVNDEEFKENFCSKIFILADYTIHIPFKNEDELQNMYKKIKKTRNALAHGLLLQSVDFDRNTLEMFLIIFYLLVSYYKKIYKASN